MRPLMRIAPLALVAAVGLSSAAQTRANDLVVNPAWVERHLKDPNLVVFEVGIMDGPTEFAKGHIPGARYIDMSQLSLSSMNHKDSLMLEMPSAGALHDELAALGISDNSEILVYTAQGDISPATRVMLTLDYAGLGARSHFLDGGRAAWKKAGFATSTTATTPATPGHLSQLRLHPVVVTLAQVSARLHDPSFHLVDARARVFYDGIEEGGMKPTRKGHIPGAHSIPFTSVSDESAQLRSPAELAALFSAAGIGPGDTVVAYCHIGQQATAVLFAARTLGHPVMLFDGSFQEWGRTASVPVENPADAKK